MGYMRHDAIVVTAFDKKYIAPAIAKARELGLCVSSMTKEVTNGYRSFLIAPDGSKEGWDTSQKGDDARAAWKEWANKSYKKGVYLDWVHVSFAGDEDRDTKIVDQAERRDE